MTDFDRQCIQIASLGVWAMVSGLPMKKRLEQVPDPRWAEKSGLFVTLRKNGKVCGSQGMLASTSTLPETLFDVGGQAATHDQRFPPITDNDMPDLEIDVTILSEMKKLNDPGEIKVGTHGIFISRGQNQAALLPSVAVECQWTPEQFLEAACEKAKLSHKAWKDPNTLVEIFTSRLISGGRLYPQIEEFI